MQPSSFAIDLQQLVLQIQARMYSLSGQLGLVSAKLTSNTCPPQREILPIGEAVRSQLGPVASPSKQPLAAAQGWGHCCWGLRQANERAPRCSRMYLAWKLAGSLTERLGGERSGMKTAALAAAMKTQPLQPAKKVTLPAVSTQSGTACPPACNICFVLILAISMQAFH